MNGIINVLFCLDDIGGDYTRHCAVTLLSLLETNKKNKIKIYILSSILPKGNIDELKRIVNLYNQKIEFIITNNIVPKELKEVIINKNSSAGAVRYRWFSPLFIKGVDRILSLDCDVLVTGDISSIYNMNMHGKAIAGYYDIWPFRCKNKIFGIKNYINAGVLLFDLNKYDVKKITVDKMLEINDKYSQYFHGNDQDKINIIFNDDILIYNRGMNYQITSRFFNNGLNNAKIIHCLNKPYIQYSNIPKRLVKLYNYYLDKTKRKGYPVKKANYGVFMNIYINIRNFLFHGLIRLLGDNLSEKLFNKIGKIFL